VSDFIEQLTRIEPDFRKVAQHIERCLSAYPAGQHNQKWASNGSTSGPVALSHLPSSADFLADVAKTAKRALSEAEFTAFRLVWIEGRVRESELSETVVTRIRTKCVAAWREHGIIPLTDYFSVDATLAKERATKRRIERAQQLRTGERELERKAERERDKYLQVVWKRINSFRDWLENADGVDPAYRQALANAEKKAHRIGAVAPK
jgi:hypothetical protein